jgi:hypothetical protein
LPPEGQVLDGETAARHHDGTEEPDQQGKQKAHGQPILLQLETTTISAPMAFRRSTGSQDSWGSAGAAPDPPHDAGLL